MGGYSRLGGAGVTSSRLRPHPLAPATTPVSRPPDDGAGRGGFGSSTRGGGGGSGAMKLCHIVERLLFFLISAMFRLKGVLLCASMLYIICMLLYMGSLNIDSGGGVAVVRVVLFSMSLGCRGPCIEALRFLRSFESFCLLRVISELLYAGYSMAIKIASALEALHK